MFFPCHVSNSSIAAGLQEGQPAVGGADWGASRVGAARRRRQGRRVQVSPICCLRMRSPTRPAGSVQPCRCRHSTFNFTGKRAFQNLRSLAPLPIACRVELVRWSEKDKGCQKTVGHAKAIFNSAFCEPAKRQCCVLRGGEGKRAGAAARRPLSHCWRCLALPSPWCSTPGHGERPEPD
jgi:hypothetical protein